MRQRPKIIWEYKMAWFWFSILSAFLWGGVYVIYERLLVTMSAASAMFICALGSSVVYASWALYHGQLKQDISALKIENSEWKLLLLIMVIHAFANLALLQGMKEKNATLVGMVEITYPIFTALISWFLFKQFHVNPGSIVGFLLVMIGVACIYYFEKTA